jgi:hypothetical protein
MKRLLVATACLIALTPSSHARSLSWNCDGKVGYDNLSDVVVAALAACAPFANVAITAIGGAPNRPPAPAADLFDSRRSGTRSPRFRLRNSLYL